ncbi:MAG: BrnA antitoxin family protein [Azoarcus sp.]|jgi:uncharacterized protein (DUF4415 family)|nr:BrnA antitoxin family protein [Azoarcus sp.]
MKSDVIAKTPFDKGAMAAALAAAPERVDDPDCPYDPNDLAAVEAFWKNAIVSHSPVELKTKLAARRRRGAQKAPVKERVTLRLSPEVAQFFRATGRGWQTRMDSALQDWIKSHSTAS